MNRNEAESKIRDLLVEIGKISKEYGTADYLNLVVYTKSNYLGFNDEYWEEDEGHKIDYNEHDGDF